MPLVRLYDIDFKLIATLRDKDFEDGEITFKDRTLTLPRDHSVTSMLAKHMSEKRGVLIAVDEGETRWHGQSMVFEMICDEDAVVRAYVRFEDAFPELTKLIWDNPFSG